MKTVKLLITGMTCNHCVQAVTRALSACEGVATAEVDLASASAVVKGDNFATDCLVKAVETSGYAASISDNKESS